MKPEKALRDWSLVLSLKRGMGEGDPEKRLHFHRSLSEYFREGWELPKPVRVFLSLAHKELGQNASADTVFGTRRTGANKDKRYGGYETKELRDWHIRARRKAGSTYSELMKEFHLGKTSISNICNKG